MKPRFIISLWVKIPPVCVHSEQGSELPQERGSGRETASVLEARRGSSESEGSWDLCTRWRRNLCRVRWRQSCSTRNTGGLKVSERCGTSSNSQYSWRVLKSIMPSIHPETPFVVLCVCVYPWNNRGWLKTQYKIWCGELFKPIRKTWCSGLLQWLVP